MCLYRHILTMEVGPMLRMALDFDVGSHIIRQGNKTFLLLCMMISAIFIRCIS